MGSDFRSTLMPVLSAPNAFPDLATAAYLHNLSPARLVEHILARGEAQLAANGAVVARTGEYTGRTPKSRFIVRSGLTAERVAWGAVNQPIAPERFEHMRRRVAAYLEERTVYVQDCYAGGDPAYQLRVRVVTEHAWHALFARQLFLRPAAGDRAGFVPDWTVVATPGCEAIPAEDGTPAGAFILLDFDRRLVLIGGTGYAGEIKKSVFSVLNFLLPARGVLPMHCSANVGANGETAIFFGLSGTGKTTLSADPERQLIGDDEHGWSDAGVFNFEGGCYAKCIRLSQEREPDIWGAIRFGTVLENVVLSEEEREPDFDSDRVTENTRAAYPLEYCGAESGTLAPHPRHMVLLTADAFGVMPPVARLSHEQALYHFLSGYTAKLGGTEAGVKEPVATFSACFGEPFLPLPPATYARMLGERLARHGVKCWLINTGWTGGGYGQGERIPLQYTRAMVRAALAGALDQVEAQPDPFFGVSVPVAVPGVPERLLRPCLAWPDAQAFEAAARGLVAKFQANFGRFSQVPAAVEAAGPQAS